MNHLDRETEMISGMIRRNQEIINECRGRGNRLADAVERDGGEDRFSVHSADEMLYRAIELGAFNIILRVELDRRRSSSVE
ncbi:MAG: hypothetical protein UY76_C0010G0017 [Candidatus Uhrbacteria bacterium GW2011_GWA2_52_8d]|uniref:Uncharacterized protein n=1 Tax=Candidatus Uhrbacteria bacterium GW2011_GWA2_52_8d TaxID=1618979 RepID=A0A0G1XQA4_9BACT|nr:MAG: hypothetical protein UY76_C0010G0017 [Candidatus Uhrbacteria bacterium GW2011_GWA2_52_8d]